MFQTPTKLAPHFRSLLRIVIAFTFALHGFQKWFGLFGATKAVFPSLSWFAGGIETLGGVLLFLGLFTRPVAFVLSGEMAVAYFLRHSPRGFWPIRNGGELAVVYCFVFLYFVLAGPGSWSLDRLWRKR